MASSERRRAANRQNAMRSTGPKTDEGKEVARANAYKHGMTAVVVVPWEERGETARRTDALQKQLAPDGNELGMILARHAALLSMQVERCAHHAKAMTEERVRTAEADHIDVRRTEAEHLFTYIGAEGPTNHRRLLAIPEGVDLLIDQMEALQRVGRAGGAPWEGSHGSAFDHLTGRRYHTPVTRMMALSNLIDRDDLSGLDPAEIQGDDRLARRAWANAEVAKLVDAELAQLRARRAAFDQNQPPATPAADRATVGSDKAALLIHKYQFAAHRAMMRTLAEIRTLRRDEKRRADPVAKGNLLMRVAQEEPNPRALPPLMASFFPDLIELVPITDASTFDSANDPTSPLADAPITPKPSRYTP